MNSPETQASQPRRKRGWVHYTGAILLGTGIAVGPGIALGMLDAHHAKHQLREEQHELQAAQPAASAARLTEINDTLQSPLLLDGAVLGGVENLCLTGAAAVSYYLVTDRNPTSLVLPARHFEQSAA
ncbi:MAG: hypothetical protein JWN38_4 [Candidatus Saccharibacteria bacterium]|nr:hypothetical protein [Candidatus Saccharibacteria bacterium]